MNGVAATNTLSEHLLGEHLKALLSLSRQHHHSDFADWKQVFFGLCADYTSSWERALLGGAQADCVGYAFAAGYQAALQQLKGDSAAGTDRLSALCVTESTGNHPRAIATTLTPAPQSSDFILRGSKTFISGGDQADELLVAARTGTDSAGRPVLKLVSVASHTPGVKVIPMAALPFVPEVAHASVEFHDVLVTEQAILPGDGYRDYVKPFRTREDIHVCLALCGYLLTTARLIQLPPQHIPQLLSLAAQHVQLSLLPAYDPVTHLLLEAARQQLEQSLQPLEAHWAKADARADGDTSSWANWQRDKALLKVAAKARESRTATALGALLP